MKKQVLHLAFLLIATGTMATGCGDVISDTSVPNVIAAEDRVIPWSPGIPGGIPTYPNGIVVTSPPYNAAGDGITDDTTAIQNAIDDCSNGEAVYLPSGTYLVSATLVINQKSIVLRGAGSDTTHIKSISTSGSIISLEPGSSNTQANVTGGFKKGSTTITVDNGASFQAGDIIRIDQENDPATTFDMLSYQRRAVAQIMRATSVGGNTISVNRPLYTNYNLNMSPIVRKVNPITRAGIESLSVERINRGGAHNIAISSGVECWIKNVSSYKTTRWHVRMTRSYACEIRGSYFYDAHSWDGDRGYGVGLFEKTTDTLVENNIFNLLRHSMIIEYGGTGNVFGYNYSINPRNNDTTPDWLMADMSIHGGSPYMNLFEGNLGAHMNPDNAIGSNFSNTFFRNHATATSLPSVRYHLIPVDIHKNSLYINVIGNILGGPTTTGTGWRLGCNSDGRCSDPDPRVEATLLNHGNYNFPLDTVEWDPDVTDKNLPSSLYLNSKPSFFGNKRWPMFGPDLTPMTGVLPAEERFVFGASVDVIPPSPPQNMSGQAN